MLEDNGLDVLWDKAKILLKNLNKIKTLKGKQEILKKFISDNSQIFEEILGRGLETAKEKNPIMSMWNVTKLLAENLTKNSKAAATKWNLILNKDLGYSGFADKSGRRYIHPSEPMQAVFLNRKAFTLLHRVENKPKKNIKLSPLYKKGDIFKSTRDKSIHKIIKMEVEPHQNIINYDIREVDPTEPDDPWLYSISQNSLFKKEKNKEIQFLKNK